MTGSAEAAPNLPDLSSEQRIAVGTTVLTELGFGDHLEDEVTFENETVVTGKFLIHPDCYEKALPAIVRYKSLERDRSRSLGDYEAYDNARKKLRSRIGAMLQIEIEEEPLG
jgi:hypothetical protein